MKRKQQNARRRKGSKLQIPKAPSASATLYNGIIPHNTSNNGICMVLREDAIFSTGAGTSFFSTIDNNPSSCDNWSEYSTAWGEYRVLGVRLEFVPNFGVNTTTVLSGPLINSILHGAHAITVGSYAAAFSYGDARMGHTTKRYTREWRMNGVDEASWRVTSAPAATSFVAIGYAEGLTTGTTYGHLFVTYFVQFRTSTT